MNRREQRTCNKKKRLSRDRERKSLNNNATLFARHLREEWECDRSVCDGLGDRVLPSFQIAEFIDCKIDLTQNVLEGSSLQLLMIWDRYRYLRILFPSHDHMASSLTYEDKINSFEPPDNLSS